MFISPKRFADHIIQRRKRVILAVAVLSLVAGAGLLKLETEFDPQNLVPPDNADQTAASELLRHFGPDPERVVVLLRSDSPLDAAQLSYLHRVSRALDSAAWTGRVDSLSLTALPHVAPVPTDLDAAERSASTPDLTSITRLVETAPDTFPSGLTTLSSLWRDEELRLSAIGEGESLSSEAVDLLHAAARLPPAVGRLISEDGKSAVITATVPADVQEICDDDREVSSQLKGLLDSIPPPSDLRVTLGGLPYLRASLERELETDQRKLVGLSCLGSVLILLIGFRSWRHAALAMASVGVTLSVVVGAMGHAGIPIGLLSNMLPALLVTIGLGDAVHLLVRYGEECRRHQPLGAARNTLSALAGPCLITSTTTAVGFASLLAAGTPAVREFGALAAGSVLIAYAVTTLLLPSVLGVTNHAGPKEFDGASRMLSVIARSAAAQPWTVLCLTGAIAVGAAFACRLLRTDAALLEQFDPEEEVLETTRHLEDHLGGVRRFDVLLTSQGPVWKEHAAIAQLAEFDAWLESQPLVIGADSLTDTLALMWSMVTRGTATDEAAWQSDTRIAALVSLFPEASPRRRFLSEDGSRSRLVVRLADAPVGEINQLLQDIEQDLSSRFPDVQVGLSGEAVRASRGLHRVVDELLHSLGLAVIVIFLMMTLLFRDVRLGLLSVPPNLFPLVVVLGYMGVRAIPLHAATVIVLPVTFGLAVDGTIHLLCRFREDHRTQSLPDAIDSTYRESGRAMALASLTLLFGFVALVFSSFRPIRLFAELSTVAIAAALLAELTLLPALLSLGGCAKRDPS